MRFASRHIGHVPAGDIVAGLARRHRREHCPGIRRPHAGEHPQWAPDVHRLVVHLDGLGRVDVTGALALQSLLEEAEEAGLTAHVVDVPSHAARLVGRVLDTRNVRLEGGEPP